MQKIFLNDIKNGTRSNVIKFIIAMLFGLVVCMYLNHRAEVSSMVKDDPLVRLSGQDYMLYFFGGMPECKEGQEKAFEVPFIWMAVQMLVCSCVFLYPVKDLHGRGMTFLLKNGSRVKWWLSKCIWVIIQVLCIYVFIGIGVMVAAWRSAGGDIIHIEVFRILENIDLLDNVKIEASMILCPVLYSIAISMVQINMSLMIEPVPSMVFVVSYHVMSSYIMSKWIFGNISMLYRMENVVVGGQNPTIGIIGCIVAAMVSLIWGTYYFKHLDIQ